MGNSFVNVPLLPGAVADHLNDEHVLFKADQPYTIVSLSLGMLNGGGPVGGFVSVIVGPDLVGTANIDFALVTVLDGDQTAQVSDLSVGIVEGQELRFKVSGAGGNATELFGTVTLQPGLVLAAGVLYATLREVQQAIGPPDDFFSDDEKENISRIIEAVSRAFDAHVGVSFVATPQVEFHDGWSLRNGIALHRMPSEVAITRNNATVEENGTLLTKGVDWFFEPYPSRMIYRTNGTVEGFGGVRFAAGERNIKVSYDSAFTNLPAEITRACRDESVQAWQGYNWGGGTGGRIGLNSLTPAEGTAYDFAVVDLSPSTLRILRPYREGRYSA